MVTDNERGPAAVIIGETGAFDRFTVDNDRWVAYNFPPNNVDLLVQTMTS